MWDSEVESDDLGATLSTGDLDQVMHEESRLDGLKGLTQADRCKLSDNDSRNIWVDLVVAEDLRLILWVVGQLSALALLNGLLQVGAG